MNQLRLIARMVVLSCLVAPAVHAGFTRKIQIDVTSGRNNVQVKVNHALAYQVESNMDDTRGLHVIVLNQASGSIMAQEVFDMYDDDLAAEEMVDFLNRVSPGRILVFAILDEGSYRFSAAAREYIERYGSKDVGKVAWRWAWAMVCFNEPNSMVNESYSENPLMGDWAKDTNITAEVTLKSAAEVNCRWLPEKDEVVLRRKHFCSRFEGYGSVCDCKSPTPIKFYHDPIFNSKLVNVPVAVIASNRPHYLFRMLQTMLQVKGSDPGKTVVFVDGNYHMPVEVAKLFGVKSVLHTPMGTGVGRVSHHYKTSLRDIFSIYPKSRFAIVLEDDLEVSPDFFSYFSQTLPVLDKDTSLYCVSAWNDQGYDHTCNDAGMLYRVETMPGLGWVMKRDLFEIELEPKWPKPEDKLNWDMWMRQPNVRQGRECIIPDVSRTYHFGVKGVHMFKQFHDQYFANHTMNTVPDVKLRNLDKMTKPLYEVLIIDLIMKAQVLDHSKTPCDEGFFPNTTNKIYIMYISMSDSEDFTTFKEIARCLKIWDLDMRGFHKSMWRMFYNRNQLLIVGTPASQYAKIAMPKDIKPITFRAPKDEL